MGKKFCFDLFPGTYAVCRLDPAEPFPEWVSGSEILSLTRTPEEVSIICREGLVPDQTTAELGWKILRIQGPLPFSLTGVLAQVAQIVSDAGVSLFAFSTYDTDYFLLKETALQAAVQALEEKGHRVGPFQTQGPSS